MMRGPGSSFPAGSGDFKIDPGGLGDRVRPCGRTDRDCDRLGPERSAGVYGAVAAGQSAPAGPECGAQDGGPVMLGPDLKGMEVRYWFDQDQASEWFADLGIVIAPRTLSQWRVEGRGPAYHKFGRLVRYHRDALRDWTLSQVRNTQSAPLGGWGAKSELQDHRAPAGDMPLPGQLGLPLGPAEEGDI